MFSYRMVVFGLKQRIDEDFVFKELFDRQNYIIYEHIPEKSYGTSLSSDVPDIPSYHCLLEYFTNLGYKDSIMCQLKMLCFYFDNNECHDPLDYFSQVHKNKMEFFRSNILRPSQLFQLSNTFSPSQRSILNLALLGAKILNKCDAFLARGSEYLPPDQSVAYVSEWCQAQDINLAAFTEDWINCLDRKVKSKNTLYFQGVEDSSFSFILDSIIEACEPFVVRERHLNSTGYKYFWKRFLSKRLIVLSGTHFDNKNYRNNLLEILEGTPSSIMTSASDSAYVQTTPVVIDVAGDRGLEGDIRSCVESRSINWYTNFKTHPPPERKLDPKWLCLVADNSAEILNQEREREFFARWRLSQENSHSESSRPSASTNFLGLEKDISEYSSKTDEYEKETRSFNLESHSQLENNQVKRVKKRSSNKKETHLENNLELEGQLHLENNQENIVNTDSSLTEHETQREGDGEERENLPFNGIGIENNQLFHKLPQMVIPPKTSSLIVKTAKATKRHRRQNTEKDASLKELRCKEAVNEREYLPMNEDDIENSNILHEDVPQTVVPPTPSSSNGTTASRDRGQKRKKDALPKEKRSKEAVNERENLPMNEDDIETSILHETPQAVVPPTPSSSNGKTASRDQGQRRKKDASRKEKRSKEAVRERENLPMNEDDIENSNILHDVPQTVVPPTPSSSNGTTASRDHGQRKKKTISRRSKGGQGIGRQNGAKRLQKRDHPRGISKLAIRSLARKGGVKRVSAGVYHEIPRVHEVFLRNLIRNANLYAEQDKRQVLTAADVARARNWQEAPFSSFGDTTPRKNEVITDIRTCSQIKIRSRSSNSDCKKKTTFNYKKEQTKDETSVENEGIKIQIKDQCVQPIKSEVETAPSQNGCFLNQSFSKCTCSKPSSSTQQCEVHFSEDDQETTKEQDETSVENEYIEIQNRYQCVQSTESEVNLSESVKTFFLTFCTCSMPSGSTYQCKVPFSEDDQKTTKKQDSKSKKKVSPSNHNQNQPEQTTQNGVKKVESDKKNSRTTHISCKSTTSEYHHATRRTKEEDQRRSEVGIQNGRDCGQPTTGEQVRPISAHARNISKGKKRSLSQEGQRNGKDNRRIEVANGNQDGQDFNQPSTSEQVLPLSAHTRDISKGKKRSLSHDDQRNEKGSKAKRVSENQNQREQPTQNGVEKNEPDKNNFRTKPCSSRFAASDEYHHGTRRTIEGDNRRSEVANGNQDGPDFNQPTTSEQVLPLSAHTRDISKGKKRSLSHEDQRNEKDERSEREARQKMIDNWKRGAFIPMGNKKTQLRHRTIDDMERRK